MEIKNLKNIFIHKTLRTNIEEYGKANILLYIMLTTTFFASSYAIYYEITNDNIHIIKHIANIVGFLAGPIGLFSLKFNPHLKTTFSVILILAICLIFTSTYFSGGIHSIDLVWMIILTIVSFLFNGSKHGIFIMLLSILSFLIFYILDKYGVKDFESENKVLGLSYKIYNLIFILLLASGISFFFINGINKIKRELDEIKELHLKSLDFKYKYVTDNVHEIIALHTIEHDCTFISPSVFSLLGFEPKEMLNKGYLNLIGESFENRQIECHTKDSKTIWLEISFNKINSEIDSKEAYISIARDVTSKILEDKKTQELRQQIANDFHDEMGNKLASITLNSSILALKLPDNPELYNIVSKIEQTSKLLYSHSRDFIWSIDSKSDDLQEIFIYLKDFCEDFFEPLNINYKNSINIEHREIILPTFSGRQIILVFKEVLTNVAKHSNCKNTLLSLFIEEDFFVVSFKDDGIGIQNNKIEGRGLKSIKQRAQNIHCELKIVSDLTGTEVILKGKLPNKPNKYA